MLVIVPISSALVLFSVLWRRGLQWRQALLYMAVTWSVTVVVQNDILSIGGHLTAASLTFAWLALTAAASIFARTGPNVHKSYLPTLDKTELLMAVSIAVILGAVGLTAILCPPNTWDAMDYHMTRVAMWASNNSVMYYPTGYTQQLFLGPWAEYTMLQLYLTGHGDRFVNLVEWFGLAGGGVAASLVAQQLGASRKGQWLAALAAVTIPGAVLESSGAMNCTVVAFWLAVAVYFLLRASDNPSWSNFLLVGLALGLGVMSKGVVYFFAPPLLAVSCFMTRRSIRRQFVGKLLVAGGLVIVLNAPQYVWNVRLSGSPLGFPTQDGDPRHSFAPSAITLTEIPANLVRHVSLHLGTPSDRVNRIVEAVLRRVIRGIGADPDDPASTRGPFRINRTSGYEIFAGNPVHFVFLAAATLLSLAFWRSQARHAALFATGLIGAFLLGSTLLRWTAWNGRFFLPVFVLGASLIGLLGARWCRTPLLSGVILLMAGPTLFLAFGNSLRPLVPRPGNRIFLTPRHNLYFNDEHQYLRSSYVAAAEAVRAHECRELGIDSSLLRFDYPMLALIRAGIDTRVRYTGVINASTRFESRDPRPAICTVICLGCARNRTMWAKYRSVGGRVSIFDDVAVFSKWGDIADSEPVPELQPNVRLQIINIGERIERWFAVIRAMDLQAILKATAPTAGSHDLFSRMDALHSTRTEAEHIHTAALHLLGKESISPEEEQFLMAAAEAIELISRDLEQGMASRT